MIVAGGRSYGGGAWYLEPVLTRLILSCVRGSDLAVLCFWRVYATLSVNMCVDMLRRRPAPLRASVFDREVYNVTKCCQIQNDSEPEQPFVFYGPSPLDGRE
jgi:hypothetical protein